MHEFLEVTERYSAWFKRMIGYGFEENSDYLGCKVFNTLARQELQDHAITLDMAKDMAKEIAIKITFSIACNHV